MGQRLQPIAFFIGQNQSLFGSPGSHLSLLHLRCTPSQLTNTLITYFWDRRLVVDGACLCEQSAVALDSWFSSDLPRDPSYTITSTTPHFAFPGDTVVARRGSDSTYNCAWLVESTQTGVPSSTTLFVTTLPGTQCAPDGSGSTGGTLLSGSSGVRIAHSDALTEEVASLHLTDLFVEGDQTGGSINCLEADNGGNVKDFIFENLVFNGCRYGVNGFTSGQLSAYGYIGGMVTPDSTPQLAAIDFVNNGGQIFIQGAESERSNYRFFVSTGGPGSTNTHLDAISFQSQAPTDDIVILSGGALTLTNSLLENMRASGSVPFVSLSPLFSANAGSLISLGNTYTNTATGCAGPSCGWIPVKDGSGNIWHATRGSFYDGKQTNITSLGDQGTVFNTAGNTIPPECRTALVCQQCPAQRLLELHECDACHDKCEHHQRSELDVLSDRIPDAMAVVKQDAAHLLEGRIFHPGVLYSDHQLEGKVLPREGVRIGRRHHPGKHNLSRFGLDPSHEQSFPFRREHHNADQRVIGGL
jgi:hypothetical protein